MTDDVAITVPADLRRIVAGAIREAADNLDVKAQRCRPGRFRDRAAREARQLRDLAEDLGG